MVYTARIVEVLVGAAALMGAWLSYKSRHGGRSARVRRAAYTSGYLLMGLAFLGFAASHHFLFSGKLAHARGVLVSAETMGAIGVGTLAVALILSLLDKLGSRG